MTEDRYNEVIQEFKKIITSHTKNGLKKGDLEKPLIILQVIDDDENPLVAKIEGLEGLLADGMFEAIPQVLKYAYEAITPLAAALIARVRVMDSAEDVVIEDVTLPRDVDSLFIYIETFDKECVMCWRIEPGEEKDELVNIHNPKLEWKEKNDEDGMRQFRLLPECYVYIEPEL